MPAPANDNIANAQQLTSGTSITGDTTEATVESSEGAGDLPGTPGPTVWFRWTCPTPAPGPVTFSTVGSSFDTVLGIFRKAVAAPTGWASLVFVAGDDQSGGSNTSLVTFVAIAGVTYWVQVAGYDSASFGAFVLNYPAPGAGGAPAGNAIATAVTLVPGTTSTAGLVDNADATTEAGEVTGTGDSASTVSAAGHRTVWWRWVAPFSGSATITTAGSVRANLSTALDTYLTIFRAKSGVSEPVTAVADLDCVGSNEDVSGTDFTSAVTFTAVKGVVYYVQVRGNSTSTFGYYALTYPSPAVEGAQSLFTTQTPSSTNNSDGTPSITVATTVTFAVSGKVHGIRYFATDNTGGTWTGLLWQVTGADTGTPAGTLLASRAGPTPVAGWNELPFVASSAPAPVSVSAGTPYRVGIHNTEGRYVSGSGTFAAAITNGNITGIQDNTAVTGLTLRNGTFQLDGTIAYPGVGVGNAYFVDVLFVPDAAGPVTHTATVTLTAVGGLTATATVDTSGAVTLTGSGGLAGTGAVTAATTAGLAGVGALTADSVRTTLAAGTLAGTGGLAGTVTRTAITTVVLAGTGGLAATGDRTTAAAGMLAAAGTLTATATVVRAATVVLAGAGALTAAGDRTTVGAATLPAVGALDATGTVVTPGVSTTTLTAVGALAGVAAQTVAAVGVLTATGTLTGIAARTTTATVGLAAAGTLTGTTFGASIGQGILTAVGALTATTGTRRRRAGRYRTGSVRPALTPGGHR